MKIPVPKINIGGLFAKVKGLTVSVLGKLPVIGKRFQRDPADEQDGSRDAEEGTLALAGPQDDDDSDIPDYLKPTFFQRHQRFLPVAGAYGLFFLILLFLGIYTLLNASNVEMALEEARPRAVATEFLVVAPEPEDQVAQNPDSTNSGEPGDQQDGQTDENIVGSEENAPLPPPVEDEIAGTLAPHPDPALIEDVAVYGLLPIVASDGRTPWQVYARPSSVLEQRPRVAVLVTGLGLSTTATERAIAMPGPVTLSFSPYAARLEDYIQEARDKGHEVMIDLPMEPRDFPRSDAGVLSLMRNATPEQNTVNLRRVLSEGSGYTGVVSNQGSGFTDTRAAVQPIMREIADRGLIYFDTLENPTSVAPDEASLAGAPYAAADVVLNGAEGLAGIRAKLSQAEIIASTEGSVVVVVRPFPQSLNKADDWVRTLAERNLAITPLSGVISARQRAGRT